MQSQRGELKGVLDASLPAGLHRRHDRPDVARCVHSNRPAARWDPQMEATVHRGLNELAVVPRQRSDPELSAGDRRTGDRVDDVPGRRGRQPPEVEDAGPVLGLKKGTDIFSISLGLVISA
eukprot:SAG11_NODE_5982_length_1419_cov_1.503788_2_plen_121_part_00